MGKLEIFAEAQGVRAGDIAKGFEVVHSKRVPLVPGTANELSQDVERNLKSRNRINDADRNDEDEAKRNTVENDAGGRIGGPTEESAQ